ncbi:unnamed protein product [Cylindrotheca closterium]|uniref:DUF7467 domain-containing protein n=1 Tax=Cylindrotheca closterium TaxID=2856 RepID=A0AAD2FMV2_9STRA|nr:unnamed protein product [Cylindrotheca closterium]
MKLSLIALSLLAGCSARVHPKLRGIAKEEEKEYYDLMLQQAVSSLTAAPTQPRMETPPPTPPPTPPQTPPPTPPQTPPPTPQPSTQGNLVTPAPVPATPSPTARSTKAPTKNPTKAPTQAPFAGPSTEAPTSCNFVIDNCPESCFSANQSQRPLQCTDNDIQRPDCNELPFPPLESCPLCCPELCMMDVIAGCVTTPVPTIEPSPAPSPVPTPCRDLTVLCPERCWEVDPFDRLPLCVDFNRPDCDTLPFPADGCPTCCPSQCVDAPELGDCSPTPLPSIPPSLEPTQCIPPPGCPSTCADVTTPNSLCSAECIACPPVDCEVDIQIAPTCPTLSCGWDTCDSAPLRFEFLFQGGACSSSAFERCAPGSDPCTCTRSVVDQANWPAGFSCNDLNGGPPAPTQVQARSWIEVLGGGTTYFEGQVRVGTSFNVTSPNGLALGSTITIRIFEFDAANNGPGDALQVVTMASTCAGESLFLTDKFGASRVVEFQDQNSLGSLFQPTPVQYTLGIAAGSDATQLQLSTANIVLLSPGNFGRLSGPQLGNVDVVGVSVPPTQTLTTDFVTVPDEDHRILASFGGVVDGRECFGIQESLFSCPSS